MPQIGSAPPILLVEMSPYASYGGTKVVLVNLVRALDRDRFAPHVLVYRDGPWVTDLRALGVPVSIHDAHGMRPEAADAAAPAAPAGAAEAARDHGLRRSPLRHAAWELRNWAQYFGHDAAEAKTLAGLVPPGTRLVHLNHSLVNTFSWFHVAQRLRLPFVLHEHGSWRARPAVYRRIAARAASVACLTEERVRQLQGLMGPHVHADYVPNGIPTAALAPRRPRADVRADLGVPDACALLVTAGHLQTWKGQALAVEAAALLAARGVDFQWLLPGGEAEPAYAAALRRRIAGAGLESRVRLLGMRSDLPDLFAACDLAVHTSIEPEPFGLVIVEAMLQGLAVVGPAEGSVPSIVRHDVDGLLVPPRDAAALADAIASLVAAPARRQAMGRSAHERVLATFDAGAMARRMEAIYARALGAKA